MFQVRGVLKHKHQSRGYRRQFSCIKGSLGDRSEKSLGVILHWEILQFSKIVCCNLKKKIMILLENFDQNNNVRGSLSASCEKGGISCTTEAEKAVY